MSADDVVAYGALQLVYGPLSDRHGRQPILMLGQVVARLAFALNGATTQFFLRRH